METVRAERRSRVRGLHQLSAIEVQNAKQSLHDGGGLWLRVREDAARWSLRYTLNGVRRELALGPCFRHSREAAARSLTDARAAATEARSTINRGDDPLGNKRAQKAAAKAEADRAKAAAAKETATLARVARAYHERVVEPERSTKHAQQWINSLERYVPAEIWHAPIASITAPQLLDFFITLTRKLPETASRVSQRLQIAFRDAEFRGLCAGNPAQAAAQKLREVRITRKSAGFKWLPYVDAPAFMTQLRQQQGVAPLALEFGLLTAARTNEILGATFAEIRDGVWTIPADRMKGGEEHVVYLPPRAAEIVEQMRGFGSSLIFPAPRDLKSPLSNMALLQLVKRMKMQDRTTPHGLCRKTFSSWANDTAAARPDVIEACLAHKEQDVIRRTYNKAQFISERKALLLAWANYLEGREAGDNVAPLQKAA